MGLDRLARQLLDTGEVTREQIEEARRTQSFFGGQLGSHLLKLGFVDEEALGRALSEVSGAPYASREQLQVLADDALRLGSSLRTRLERLQICPFEIHDRTVRVAMLNPRDAVALAEVRAASGYEVEPWVTCEYRLYQALERHFGVEDDRRQGVSLAPAARNARRRATDRPADADLTLAASSQIELGLDGRPLHAEVDIDDHLFARATSDLGAILDRIGGSPDVPTVEGDPWLELESALCAAEDARGIAEALLDFSDGRARRAALFARIRDGVRGIAGRGGGLETERLGVRTVPVPPLSVLDVALGGAEFFFGVVPPLPANRELYGALGGKPPAMAMVLPITIKGRVVALWYLDDDDRPMTRPEIPRMRRAAAKAGLAFEIVLLRGKLRKI